MPADKEMTAFLEGVEDIGGVAGNPGVRPSAGSGTSSRQGGRSAPPTPATPPVIDDGVEENDEEETVVEEKPKATPKHSPRALQLAAHYGISRAWVEQASPAELLSEIELCRKEEEIEERKAAKAKTAKVEADEEEEIDLGEIDDIDDDGKAVKRKAKLSDLAPPIAKVLKEQHKALKDTHKTLKEISERENRRQQEAIYDALDDGFAALGDKFAKLFGDGGGREMDRESPQMKRRMMAIQAAGLVEGDSPRAIKAKVAAAAKAAFGEFVQDDDEEKPKEKSKLEKRREEWGGAGVNKPTARKDAAGKKKGNNLDKVLEDLTNRSAADGDDESSFFDD